VRLPDEYVANGANGTAHRGALVHTRVAGLLSDGKRRERSCATMREIDEANGTANSRGLALQATLGWGRRVGVRLATAAT
jgi:hypothetical protein